MSKIVVIVKVLVPQIHGQENGYYQEVPIEIEVDAEMRSAKIANLEPNWHGAVDVPGGYKLEVETVEDRDEREQAWAEMCAQEERDWQAQEQDEKEYRQEMRGQRTARRLARARRRQERLPQS